MTTIGTCYFPTLADAIAYYIPYYPGVPRREVEFATRERLLLGEIVIGKPNVEPGQTLVVRDHHYCIMAADEIIDERC